MLKEKGNLVDLEALDFGLKYQSTSSEINITLDII